MRFSVILVQWPVHSKIIHVSKKVKVKSLSCVRLFATPWTVAHKAPPSMGFSRQEYWSGLPFPFPGDLPNPGIEPRSSSLQADALTSEPPGRPTPWEALLVVKYLKYPHPEGVSQKTCREKSADFCVLWFPRSWLLCVMMEERILQDYILDRKHSIFFCFSSHLPHTQYTAHGCRVQLIECLHVCTRVSSTRSRYRTFSASKRAPFCLLSINYPK